MIEVIKISNDGELKQAFAIRHEVFVVEQKVSKAEEYDKFETSSIHFLALYKGIPVGTARWRKVEKGAKLERFAVLESHRSIGVGSALVQAVEKDVPSGTMMHLHAQLTAVDLYAKHGFAQYGPQFEEAGIQHFAMKKQK